MCLQKEAWHAWHRGMRGICATARCWCLGGLENGVLAFHHVEEKIPKSPPRVASWHHAYKKHMPHDFPAKPFSEKKVKEPLWSKCPRHPIGVDWQDDKTCLSSQGIAQDQWQGKSIHTHPSCMSASRTNSLAEVGAAASTADSASPQTQHAVSLKSLMKFAFTRKHCSTAQRAYGEDLAKGLPKSLIS